MTCNKCGYEQNHPISSFCGGCGFQFTEGRQMSVPTNDQRGIMNELINWLWEEDNIPDGHAVIKKASELLSQQQEIHKVDLHGFLLWNKEQFAPWIPMEEKDRWIKNAAFKDSEEKTTAEVYETYLRLISKQ